MVEWMCLVFWDFGVTCNLKVHARLLLSFGIATRSLLKFISAWSGWSERNTHTWENTTWTYARKVYWGVGSRDSYTPELLDAVERRKDSYGTGQTYEWHAVSTGFSCQISLQWNPWFPKGSIVTYSWKPVKVFVFCFTLCRYWELG